jgi:hypothetical protein
MSAKSELEHQELEGADEVCAACGIAAVDNVTLKDCDGGCDLVKYCGDECQENHRMQHEQDCKKRKAELHDKGLFEQPDISHHGECPICCLPLPIEGKKSTFMTCCCKVICKGCNYANQKREIEQRLKHRCAFCREPVPESDEESNKRVMERIKKNNPVAISQMGNKLFIEGDYGKALEYFTKAAELGDVVAHFSLGGMYYEGQYVEKDMAKAIHHLEQAAIGGEPSARCLLAIHEETNGSFERAAKHYIIGANLGHDNSLKSIKDLFVQGIVSKEDYASALRGYQAAVDATKSVEREKAEAYSKARDAAARS